MEAKRQHLDGCTEGRPGYLYSGYCSAHDDFYGPQNNGPDIDNYGAYCPVCGTWVWGYQNNWYFVPWCNGQPDGWPSGPLFKSEVEGMAFEHGQAGSCVFQVRCGEALEDALAREMEEC